MRIRNLCIIGSVLLLGTTITASANPKVHRGPTSPRLFKEKSQSKPKTSASSGISPERATQIQSALVKAGYLNGSPSGVWDTETQTAMARLQADNGWQTKLIPDARAIIQLGLGPRDTAESSPTHGLTTENPEPSETAITATTSNKLI